jgi:zinc finger protein 830
MVKHASAWEGHLGSKAHRTNVVRLKEEERKRGEDVEDDRLRGKRKATLEAMDLDEDSIKRRRVELVVEQGTPEAANSASFPNDFFSDPSRAALPSTSDDSDDEADTKQVLSTTAQANSNMDLEWEIFERTLLNAPDHRETYERATVMAEPVLASETPEGFPRLDGQDSQLETAAKIDDEEARRQKEQDDRCVGSHVASHETNHLPRELIMDRLLDEEAAQEEADMKVMVMKGRFEALKKRRETARAMRVQSQKVLE